MSPIWHRALVNPGGHDFGEPNLDAVGITYIVFAILYTLLVAGGLTTLWIHRHNPAVRLRGVTVSFAAIITLHIYLLLVLGVYPENGLFACGTEFWIMSIALPFGQALFQACNVQVFSFADRQLRLLDVDSLENLTIKKTRFRFTLKGLMEAWNQLNIAHKTYVGIAFGVWSTLVTTFFIFFGSRMFHADFGIFGEAVDPAACRRGTEWIPSIFWQLLWTVFFGPYILYKIKDLHDVHGWAWQTRIAIVCGLPGTPLWLLFTYWPHPAVLAVNKYWVPAMWFLPSLISMQTTLWAIPVYEAIQDNRCKHDEVALNVAAKFNHARPTSAAGSDSSIVTFSTFNNVLTFSNEETLKKLQRYCAQVTMNGELVAFVRQVMQFTKKWENKSLTTEDHHQMYRDAALIYFGLVHETYADLPINLPFSVRKDLDKTFENVRFSPFHEDSCTDNVITPWDCYEFETTASLDDDTKSINGDILPLAGRNIQIPEAFDINIFKPALEVIKQDIYNSRTFHKFFEHEQTNKTSFEDISLESKETGESNRLFSFFSRF